MVSRKLTTFVAKHKIKLVFGNAQFQNENISKLHYTLTSSSANMHHLNDQCNVIIAFSVSTATSPRPSEVSSSPLVLGPQGK